MSAEIMGPQPQTTNEKNPQVDDSEPQTANSDSQELTPARPPPAREHAGENKTKRPRGFAAMDRKVVSEIARKGGKAAHSAGTAHEFTSDEARVAGRKGGRATHAKRQKVVEEQDGKTQQESE